MNEPGAFEPFVDNMRSILKREIATSIMYEHLKYNKVVAYANRKYFKPWKMPTPILRNPYASHAKKTPKATSSLNRVITPSCLKKKSSSFAGPNPTISSPCRRHQPATWEASEIAKNAATPRGGHHGSWGRQLCHLHGQKNGVTMKTGNFTWNFGTLRVNNGDFIFKIRFDDRLLMLHRI